MEKFFVVGILVLSCLQHIFMFQSDIEYDGVLSVQLLHALDNVPDAVFTDRGSINVQSIRTGSVSLHQNPLTSEEWRKLKHLAEQNGLYRLKAVVKTVDGKTVSFLTFMKACDLVASNLSDFLTVSLDHAGAPVAVSAATSPEKCHGECTSSGDLRQFDTSVFVRHVEQGPVPDTATYVQKLEKEKEARERGETKDNRSFLAKYWMYVVPVAIFVLLSGAANPEAGAAASGGGGGR